MLSRGYAIAQAGLGHIQSSSFVVLHVDGGDWKGHLVVNKIKQSSHCKKRSLKLDTIPSFALDMEKGD